MFYVLMNYLLYVMGRKKLNRTKDELDELNRIRLRRYYKNHKQEILGAIVTGKQIGRAHV